MKYYFSLLIILASIPACKNFNNRQQEPLAKVYNNYLYREDLDQIIPSFLSGEDSIKIARNYIDKWIRNQLFLKLAEINLPEKEKNIDKQIAEFRASLLIYKYQQHLLSQKLDSIISTVELEEYYENHSNNFILDKPAIRGIFIKVPVDTPNRDRILTMFRNDDDLIQMELFRDQYAVNHLWFTEHWMYLADVLDHLPPGLLNLPANITNTDNLRASDSRYHYFIGIKEYRAPKSQMPFSLASQNIKSIILNKRKIQFLNELERNVLTEGLSKNAYQYF
jgi:hypothetical protein